MSEAAALHDALVQMWARLYARIEGARFEQRPGLVLAVCPDFPIPQCNGPWVEEDSRSAVDALPEAIAEVDAAGAQPWVQTRSGHERVREATRALGFTNEERLPGMVVRPDELREPPVEIDISLLAEDDLDTAVEILATSFQAPPELFDRFAVVLRALPEASWYVGRVGGAIVSTALGVTLEGATGVFNVATPPEHRRRGYGAALTARAVRDGFDAGAAFGYLQSSAAGHRVYRALGFRDVEEYVLLSRPVPG